MGTYLRFIQTGRAEEVLRLALAIAIERPPMSGPGRMLVQGWAGRHV